MKTAIVPEDLSQAFVNSGKPVARIRIKSFSDFFDFCRFFKGKDRKTIADIIHHSPSVLGKKMTRTDTSLTDAGENQIALFAHDFLLNWYVESGNAEIIELPKID